MELACETVIQPPGPRTLRVLTVHGIGNPPRELDPGEDRVWVSVAQFEQLLDAVVGRTDIRITFDDGNASDLEIGLPRLRERGLRAEFFVLAGLLGEPGRLDAAGVRELLAAGMRVGSHGWAHRDWRSMGDEVAEQEIYQAARVLGELCRVPVRRVAVPFGCYDRRVLARLRHAGVARVYTSDGGPARSGNWLQARTSLHRDIDEIWLRDVLDGSATALASVRRRAVGLVKRWR
ncbi:MAG: polysaccharide deacetylase family protein [Pseudonocardiales bacterium]